MNRLQAYVRRTILQSATEGAYPAKRRTAESTRSAFADAMRGTDTGWWSDLIYTADMLPMAHKYRSEIAAALAEYRDETGESFVDRTSVDGATAETILAALLRRRAYTFEEYRGDDATGRAVDAVLLGLRFAVEWYAGQLASTYAPDL